MKLKLSRKTNSTPILKFDFLRARMLWHRFVWAVIGGIYPLVIFQIVKLAFGGDTYWLLEISGTAALIALLFIPTEGLVHFVEFSLPRKADYGLRYHWWRFVRRYGHSSALTRAKLFIFLCKDDNETNELRFEAALGDYLTLLCAATYLAQREWFATYTFKLSDWTTIAKFATDYTDALKHAKLIKKRIAVIPSDDITPVRGNPENEPIVRNTWDQGARIIFLAKETLSNHGVEKALELEDYAIFDAELPKERIVISGSFLEKNSPEVNGDSRMMVKVFKGEAASVYKFWRDELNKVPPDLAPSNRRKRREQ